MQIELHRHLDVSVRLSTLLSLAQERGFVPHSTSLGAFCEHFVLREPLKDLNDVLAQFKLFQNILDQPKVLTRVAREVVEDCYKEGTRKLELRFSPSFVCDSKALSWDETLDAFESGIKEACSLLPDMKVGLICIASRDYGVEAVDKTVEYFLRQKSRFIGLDLAGNEVDFPCRLFLTSFKKAKDAGSKITIHAGEAMGPENIWEAIELLGARRIGHGVSAVRDKALMEYLSKYRICLEICPTSNWLTKAVPSLKEHPLPTILRSGVPVSINTDDPGIFGITLPHEIRVCRELLGLSTMEVEKCFEHAEKASFL